jgi:hypothetical protein
MHNGTHQQMHNGAFVGTNMTFDIDIRSDNMPLH